MSEAKDGGIINTGVMGNVQAGHGTQINIGRVAAGRSVHIGGHVVNSPIITGDYNIWQEEAEIEYTVARGKCEYCGTPYEFRRAAGDPVVKCASCAAALPL